MLNKNPKCKRRILTATPLFTLLIVALAGSLFANTAIANPFPGTAYPWWHTPPPTVEVLGLNTDTLTLTFLVKEANSGFHTYHISSIHVLVDGQLWSRHEWGTKSISVSLEGLSNGWHTVEVTATATETQSGYDSSSQGSSGVIEFQVDAPPPSIRVITSQKTFEPSSSTADVPLNFTVNKPASWVGYSLDGEKTVTATHRVTATERFGRTNYQLVLNHVHAGLHSVTVYAEDLGGNRGASEPFNFTVTQQTPSETEQTEPFPTSQLVASSIVASVVAISFGLVAYFVRAKRKRSET